MELATILLIAAIIAGGTAGALVRTWSLHRRLLSLELVVSDLEGRILRETKQRAATERWKKPDADLELIKQLKAEQPPEQKQRYANDW